uniref:7TM_GPCR_Srx domain-containing protein n=1 Tax=Caenorhabditis japonica TaxID=281687 RepID=A0A8R1E7Z9_CAEJA
MRECEKEGGMNKALECFTTFSAYDLAWGPNMNARCRQKSGDGIVSGTAVFLAVLVILNLLTFTKIWLFYKSTQESDLDGKKKMKKNRMLFLQTIVQDMLYMIDMLFTYQLGGLVDERYWTFISGSFVWESVHSCDGLIMIMFNERLTFLRKSLFATSATPSTVAVISKHPPSGPARNAMSRVDISS